MAFKVDKLGFDSLTAKSMVYLKYVPEVMQGKQIKRGFRATEFQKNKRNFGYECPSEMTNTCTCSSGHPERPRKR